MSYSYQLLFILGAILAHVHCSPRPAGYDGTDFGDKSMSRMDSDFSSPYASRHDFDEGHKEDIEQESIKYHSLVNKALNTAKDADRFVGDSIKEQERSMNDYPRVKRNALPLAPSEKRNFRPVAAPVAAEEAAPVAEAVAAPPREKQPQQQTLEVQPLRRNGAAKGTQMGEIAEKDFPTGAAARGGVEDYDNGSGGEGNGNEGGSANGGDEEKGTKARSGNGAGGEVNPEKIDEMIDLMNSLNQKFAKMIANWDDQAAVGGASAGGGGEAIQTRSKSNDNDDEETGNDEEDQGSNNKDAGNDEGEEMETRRSGKGGKKAAANNQADDNAGGDYDNPEENEDGGQQAPARRSKQNSANVL